jgi:hypothetical protein
MGNNNSSNNLSADLIDTSIMANDVIFKVDNINSYGRKHASAKIEVSNDNICIKQKHRQSLHIPLETIKRYGLDGSIFILECGRHAPLGQARYAFRCKQARNLVDCLDQRITIRSKQLLEQQRRGTVISSASTLTNVSSASHHHHRRRRRTQSDQGVIRRTPSSIIFSSSSSSSISLTSRATFSYRNSEPNLSQHYLAFTPLPCHIETTNPEQGQFIARLKQPVDTPIVPELNYVEFKAQLTPITLDEEGRYKRKIFKPIFISFLDLPIEVEAPIITQEPDVVSMKESPVQQTRKRALRSLFNHHQQSKSNKTTISTNNPSTSIALVSESISTPYVYIDHEKTTTLKDIATERLQQQQARRIDT